MTKILIEVRCGIVVLVAANELCHVTIRDLDDIKAGEPDPLADFADLDDPYTPAGYTLEVF